jgi:hypothetical protein
VSTEAAPAQLESVQREAALEGEHALGAPRHAGELDGSAGEQGVAQETRREAELARGLCQAMERVCEARGAAGEQERRPGAARELELAQLGAHAQRGVAGVRLRRLEGRARGLELARERLLASGEHDGSPPFRVSLLASGTQRLHAERLALAAREALREGPCTVASAPR